MASSTTPYNPTGLRRALILLVALFAVIGTLTAHPGEAHAQTANIRVRVILASNTGSGMDASLSSIAGQLQSRFGQFNSFQQLSDRGLGLSSGSSGSVGLPSGGAANITFHGMSGTSYRIQVSVPGGGGTVTVPPGGIFFVAGPGYQGGTLVIAVSL